MFHKYSYVASDDRPILRKTDVSKVHACCKITESFILLLFPMTDHDHAFSAIRLTEMSGDTQGWLGDRKI
jgi:hypothetical protein